MDITELQSSIDDALADAAPRVMMTALEAIGPCTYAIHMPSYVRMRVALAHLDRWWWDYEHRVPEAFIMARFREIDACKRSTSEIGYPGSLRTYEIYRRELTEKLLHHHAEMYRQPCLLCEFCEHRRKLWSIAPYSPCGTPLTKRSQNLAKQLLTG